MDKEEQAKKDAQEKEAKEKAEAEAKAKAEAAAAEDAGDKEKTSATLDRADEIAERQKRENDRREKILERDEALAARKAVGGETEAGQEPVEKEESPAEYAKEVIANDPSLTDGS